MSHISARLATDRILSAPTNSPIAIFESDKVGCVEALFARTVAGQKRVQEGIDLIGVFDRTVDSKEIFALLKNHEHACPDIHDPNGSWRPRGLEVSRPAHWPATLKSPSDKSRLGQRRRS